MKSAFDANLARLISATRGSMRALFDKEGFVEVTYPHMDPRTSAAFYSTFQVTVPSDPQFAQFRGTLLVSGGRYMAEAARALGRAYRIGPSFRAEIGENCLFDFQSIHATREGQLEDILALAEGILQSVAGNVAKLPNFRSAVLQKMSFPLPRITSAEAAKLVGVEAGQDLTYEDSARLLLKMNAVAVILTDIPESINKYAVFHRVDSRGAVRNFDIILSHGAESLTGCEYEPDHAALAKRLSKSVLLKAAVELGEPAETYAAPMIELITNGRSPIASLYCGQERLVRFLTGADKIEDATLWPVNASFLLAR